MDDGDLAVQPVVASDKYAKYNVEVEMPVFTDEEYDAYLRDAEWTREETDYLLGLIQDYAYRWPVIWDRYDYQPSTPAPPPQDAEGAANALAALPFPPARAQERTMEELKARFYSLAAKVMRLRTPEVHMDAQQYTTYEILSKYNPASEKNRKDLAANLMARHVDEVKEEEFLLTELQRINMSANRLDAERAELRARLETPVPNTQSQAGLQAFQSSQALTALFNQLFQQDRSKKRQSGAAAPGGQGARLGSLSMDASGAGTPTGATHQSHLSSNSRRQSVAQPALHPPQTPLRQLSPMQEHRFNVSNHERLTSGVSFGTDKLLKMRQAKSNVQTQKIATALQELGVPDTIPIPTSRVGEVFENLVGRVGRLLDIRKVREKEEGECRVLEEMKRKRGIGGGNGASASAGASVQTSAGDATSTDTVRGEGSVEQSREDGDGDGKSETKVEREDTPPGVQADEDADGDPDDDIDAEGEDDSRAASVSTRAAGHKRSASVMSQASNKDAKRPRK